MILSRFNSNPIRINTDNLCSKSVKRFTNQTSATTDIKD